MDHPRNGKPSPIFYIVIALTILAPWLGGSVQLWAQMPLCLGTGLLFALCPPKKSLGLLPNAAFVILFALALAAFFPAHWFFVADWRIELAKLGVELPDTVSPQPWVTLQLAGLFLLELSWTYYLLAADWTLTERRQAWPLIAAGITTLAGALVVSVMLDKHVPFWPNVSEFGFFPNRNHTSNVLGLGGILVYALALRGFDERRKNWWIWLIALSLICWALILDFSRSGIILLCGGALVWHIYWAATSEHKRRPLIASVGILLLLGFIVWDGGKTAMRFGKDTGDFFSSENARFLIHRDSIAIAWNSPFVGVGLGNFNPVFNMQRHDFLLSNIAGHPESDWVWAAVELGVLGPMVIALLFGWWVMRCFPFEPRTLRLMRMAAFICGCGFALHAFVDVPGHQIGALWPAVFLASTATHPAKGFAQSGAVAIVFRLIGFLLLLAGLFWLGSLIEPARFPTKYSVRELERQMTLALDANENTKAIAAASDGLRIAPLNWFAYQGLAATELSAHSRADAERDFAVARYLLPVWSELWLKEGLLWAADGDIDRAFEVWSDMLERFRGDSANLYEQIFEAIKREPELVDRWRQLARGKNECLLVFFRRAGYVEFGVELARLLSEDPNLNNLNRDEKAALFSAWYRSFDKEALKQALQDHSDWKEIGWRQLAQSFADNSDHKTAFEIAEHYVSPPHIPNSNTEEAVTVLRPRFRLDPTNFNLGLALYFAQIREGRADEGLTTLQSLIALRGSPKYLRYMEAQLWARKGDWEKAWNALRAYEPFKF